MHFLPAYKYLDPKHSEIDHRGLTPRKNAEEVQTIMSAPKCRSVSGTKRFTTTLGWLTFVATLNKSWIIHDPTERSRSTATLI